MDQGMETGPVDDRERLRGALDELEGVWADHDMFIREIAGPGVSEDQIRAELATIDLTPPPELLTWWGWHNGVTDDAPPSTYYTQIGVEAWSQFSLRDAVRVAAEMRIVANDLASSTGMPVDLFWRREWLPLLTGGGADYFVIRCAEPHLGTLVIKDNDGEAEPDKIDAPSLFDLVSAAVRDIRTGTIADDVLRGWQARA